MSTDACRQQREPACSHQRHATEHATRHPGARRGDRRADTKPATDRPGHRERDNDLAARGLRASEAQLFAVDHEPDLRTEQVESLHEGRQRDLCLDPARALQLGGAARFTTAAAATRQAARCAPRRAGGPRRRAPGPARRGRRAAYFPRGFPNLSRVGATASPTIATVAVAVLSAAMLTSCSMGLVLRSV